MSGADLHKAGLSDLGGLGLRDWQGAGHPPAGDQMDTWLGGGCLFFEPPLGALHTYSPQ